MNLIKIKEEIESKTSYRFEMRKNILGKDCLYLKGLHKKASIGITISNYYNSEIEFIRVSGDYGTGGFGSPCNNITETIDSLNYHASDYGYVPIQFEQYGGNMEILFRGFHPCENGTKTITIDGKEHKGEWIDGYFFKIWHEYYILWGTTNGIPNMLEVLPETVGMWTGLTDKNGKKIFEGDIVEVKNCETFIIKYQHNEFRFIPICNAYTFLQAHEYNGSDFEVVGNIYDNKELLEAL